MAGFLYYLPGGQGAAGPELSALIDGGLGYAFEAKPPARRTECGPDNGQGWVLADERGIAIPAILYKPDEQKWRQIPGRQPWVGRYLSPGDVPLDDMGARFQPSDLARRVQLDGHWVPLADGQSWLIPVARAFTGDGWYCALPQRSTFDDSGRWARGEVIDRYKPLWELAGQWDAALCSALKDLQGSGERDEAVEAGQCKLIFDFDNLHEAALEALAANYRIGPVEADELGLLTEGLCAEILNAVIDLPARLELIKKKLSPQPSAGLNTGGGPAD